jgi:hypothetical protein
VDPKEITQLMEDAWSRFRTIRLAVRHRFDRAAYERGLERFTGSPFIPDLLRAFRERKDPPGVEFRGFRAWMVKPAYHRQENYRHAELRSIASISGGDGEQLWSYVLGEARVFVQPNRALVALSRSQDSDGAAYGRAAYSKADRYVGTLFVPLIGELIDPREFPLDEVQLQVAGRETYRGRPAIRVRARADWQRREQWLGENLPPADDYELLVDHERGVILRVMARFDGREFSVGEMLDVAFDEDIPLELFEPPSPPGT